MEWTTIESDPGVFTELIEKMGVKGVQVEELYALDEDLLQQLQPIHGLIFLFKYRSGEQNPMPAEQNPENIFFASQVINNACATQAILGVLMNAKDVELGDELSNMKEFTREFPADLKGLAISNSETIRTAHNSFARPEPIMEEQRQATSDDDLFHFIAYMPINGSLYELDGLKEGPINHGSVTDDNWLSRACPVIQERIARYAASEIRFNLMALIKSRKDLLEEKIASAELRKARCLSAMGGDTDEAMDEDPLPSGQDALEAELARLEAETSSLEAQVAAEDAKMQNWKDENIRRKHNYIPFIFNFLKVLAEKKQLGGLIDKAKAKQSR